MAATNLENQLHSAQKNLLFLQREHAGTLKGLHAEIRRLQQHCTGAGRGRAAGRAERGRGVSLPWPAREARPQSAGTLPPHPLCLMDMHQAQRHKAVKPFLGTPST